MLSIIIVTFNSWDLLATCLETLPQAMSGYPSEVIVIDNASEPDESPEILARFPWITIIRNSTNIGFAAANNIGLKQAKGDYFLLLNPDTEAEPGAFRELVLFLEKIGDAGIVGPKMYYPDGNLQFSCGRFPSIINEFLENFPMYLVFRGSSFIGRYLYRTWNHASCRLVDWVSGACFLFRRTALEQVGYFDESYFMYTEEVDWCYRARELGWSTYYYPKAVVIHHEGGSSRGFSSQERFRKIVYRHYIRSTRLFFRKFYGWLSEAVLRTILYVSYSVQSYRSSWGTEKPGPLFKISPPSPEVFRTIIHDLKTPLERVQINRGNTYR